MKAILILLLFALAGCSGYSTLEELEAQALVTGDWTEVERRERMILKRKLKSSIACPPGTVGMCDVSFGSKRCSCISSDTISALLSR